MNAAVNAQCWLCFRQRAVDPLKVLKGFLWARRRAAAPLQQPFLDSVTAAALKASAVWPTETASLHHSEGSQLLLHHPPLHLVSSRLLAFSELTDYSWYLIVWTVRAGGLLASIRSQDRSNRQKHDAAVWRVHEAELITTVEMSVVSLSWHGASRTVGCCPVWLAVLFSESVHENKVELHEGKSWSWHRMHDVHWNKNK